MIFPPDFYSDVSLYVVGLRRRSDRLALFRRQLPPGLNVHYSYDIGGAHDHVSMSENEVRALRLYPWRIQSSNVWWARNLKLGEAACALNHLACWRHASEARNRMAVIFEDDAHFAPTLFGELPGLVAQLEHRDPRWHLLFLGRENLGGDQLAFGPFVRPGFSYCTYSYVVSAAGLRVLLGYRLEVMLMPLDEFLIATYSDHPRPDVRLAVPKSLRAYALKQDLVVELDDRFYGSETEASRYCE